MAIPLGVSVECVSAAMLQKRYSMPSRWMAAAVEDSTVIAAHWVDLGVVAWARRSVGLEGRRVEDEERLGDAGTVDDVDLADQDRLGRSGEIDL